jgi:hypothetical protein
MGRSLDELDERERPTPVHKNIMYDDLVNMEDRIRTRGWVMQGGLTPASEAAIKPSTNPPVPRGEMLEFARSEGWRSIVKRDPQALDAIRRIRERVTSLQSESRAFVTDVAIGQDRGTILLNKRAGGPRHTQFRTSNLNPLNPHSVERGWDQRVRLWQGRQMTDGKVNLAPSSLWCEGWAASANESGFDGEFQYVRPQDKLRPAFAKELHGRGWR